MYLKHFGFAQRPFALNPDPGFFYDSEQHARALTMLEYAVESQAAFCLLTGEIGSGKTTLLRKLMRSLGADVQVGLINNTHARFRSIHPWIASALGIKTAEVSDSSIVDLLNEYLIGEYAKGRRTLLIIDEAQNLSLRTLEELRLLSNLNSESDVVLQIVLSGQPELRDKLLQPALAQFAQRIAVDFHLQTLNLAQVSAYMRHRLRVAGGTEHTFDPPAIELIHARCGGIPRLINHLCDLSLVYAYAEHHQQVSAALVEVVLQDRMRARTVDVPPAQQPVPQPL
jgi:general secretion pathway protein A